MAIIFQRIMKISGYKVLKLISLCRNLKERPSKPELKAIMFMVDYSVCKNKIYYSVKSIQLMKQQNIF